MEKIFDFEQVGKRMPYTVPDGFFDKMEEDVMESLTPSPSPRGEGSGYPKETDTVKAHITPLPPAGGAGVRLLFAVAAALALFFVVRATLPKSDPVLASADDYASVELAFNNLSADDQDFLIQVYEEYDLFINP